MDKLDSIIDEDETVFCLRKQGDGVELFIQADSEDEISAMLAVFIDRSMSNHTDEGSRRAGNILIAAVDMAVANRISKMSDDGDVPMMLRKKSDLSAN